MPDVFLRRDLTRPRYNAGTRQARSVRVTANEVSSDGLADHAPWCIALKMATAQFEDHRNVI